MKKIIIFMFIFIIICFLIPIIFSEKFEIKETNIKIDENDIKQITLSNYKTIKLLHTQDNNVEDIEIEEYIKNVVSAEMPAEYHEEALKAQAVVARTYTLYTILKNEKKHENADICDSEKCCQAWISKEDRINKWGDNLSTIYWEKITDAVNSTNGEIITYNGEIINAVYHANSGGKTEKASYIWDGRDYPYLQSVETLRRK